MHEKRNKTAPKPVETYTNPTSFTLSYTQTYTRKFQSLLGFSMPGVGSVGDFQKTFFLGGEEECRNVFYTKEDGNSKTSDFFA